jgi:hypothetical protein
MQNAECRRGNWAAGGAGGGARDAVRRDGAWRGAAWRGAWRGVVGAKHSRRVTPAESFAGACPVR